VKSKDLESGVLHALWDHIRYFFDSEPEKGGAHPASSVSSLLSPFQGMGNGMPTPYTGHKHEHYREVATEETLARGSVVNCDLMEIQASGFHRQWERITF